MIVTPSAFEVPPEESHDFPQVCVIDVDGDVAVKVQGTSVQRESARANEKGTDGDAVDLLNPGLDPVCVPLREDGRFEHERVAGHEAAQGLNAQRHESVRVTTTRRCSCSSPVEATAPTIAVNVDHVFVLTR